MVAAVLATASAAGAEDEERVPAVLPLESTGQLRFFVDVSCFRGEGGATDVEIFASITNDQLRFRTDDDDDPSRPRNGRIRMEVDVRDETGRKVFDSENSLDPTAANELDSADRAIVQVLRETTELSAGLYHLQVSLTDEYGLRTGLLNRIRRANRSGLVEGWFRVADLSSKQLAVSDLTMIRGWEVAGDAAVFGRHGVNFDPNPQRHYGLVLPRVRYYLEVYPGDDFEEGDTYVLQAQVLDNSGIPRLERTTRARPRGERFVVTDELSLEKGVPAGSYQFAVTVLGERTRESVRAIQPFEVIWSVASWGKDPDEVLQEMALIMSEKDYKTLRRLKPGAQEIFLAEFWHGLDPDPDSPGNGVLDHFRERVRFADKEFSSTLNRGILTDRGRVFVRYGRPDDIQYEYSSSGFGLDGTSERIADPAERASIASRPSTSFLDPEEFREGDLSGVAEQRGGATVKSKQLEIWVYDGPGYPLADNVDRGPSSHRGLKFIFADEMGNGNYQLIGSSGASIY